MLKQNYLSRTELLIGKEGIDKLKKSKVIVFGVGGVGSYTIEALARSGVGEITLIDDDTVCLTNLNRQIHATYKTISRPKVEVMKERILSINKDCNVIDKRILATNENIKELVDKEADYIVDAIDTVSAKLSIAEYCYNNGINIISCMGTGNKFDPTQFKIADIYDTKVCPLAKVMRHELKKRNVKKLKVLYSEEIPVKPYTEDVVTCKEACVCIGESSRKCANKRQIPGSMSFVPPVAGMIIAGEVIKSIIGMK
ncbi:tRNA threonylcarbamoyladenosine dehydratase [Clostridium sp. BJN0001]|uniref:tRNA threonylcarbamoyladenosine dehydratase n=1 Tax=Clostridium sp. BJN0001 TaxID=2930219 RepID=UPI001FD0681F|nr:tRNA threonylcarbamoyladenosine dehydratase [Clostridium sp. BJN0001]